ncbi:hypothetical protein BVX98_04220 [bacterium F11]|nr:hypothetical protein BVX98_04220 [bacterium F11]
MRNHTINKLKRKKINLFWVTVILFLLVPPFAAHAYIDPGSGMAFVSGIGAWVLAAFAFVFGALSFTFKRWTRGIKNLFSLITSKINKKK